jgi:hypothetical protein
MVARLGTIAPSLWRSRHAVEQFHRPALWGELPDSLPSPYRRAATYVQRRSSARSPPTVPIEQPTKFELVINLTTAKALGLTIPEAFLLCADAVIE